MNADSTLDVTAKLDSLLRKRACGALFINGPARAGFDALLGQLAVATRPAKGLSILGPYRISADRVDDLRSLIRDELVAQGYIPDHGTDTHLPNHKALWELLHTVGDSLQNQTFLVLIELVGGLLLGSEGPGDLFSDIRHFEGIWRDRSVQVVYAIAGSWWHQEIEEYFDRIHVSFPYSPGRNYVRWTGVDRATVAAMTKEILGAAGTPIVGDVIYELGGGHWEVTQSLLAAVQERPIKLESLWNHTRRIAQDGPLAQELLSSWRRLPPRARKLLHRLLATRCVAEHHTNERIKEPLLALGIAREVSINEIRYLRFYSPFIELCVRANLAQFELADPALERVNLDEIIPELDILGSYGYQLVRDIENLVRGYVMLQVQIGQHVGPRSFPGYRDAKEYRRGEARSGLPVEFNPLISYFSVRDLAEIVRQTALNHNADAWRAIERSLNDLVMVRNAVMHNRVIGFDALDRLQVLRGQIYTAISESYPH